MTSSRMSREDRDALITAQRVAVAVTAVVNETPAGAPSGKLYAPLMAYLSIDQFEAMMRGLVAAERISRRGDRYFPALSAADDPAAAAASSPPGFAHSAG